MERKRRLFLLMAGVLMVGLSMNGYAGDEVKFQPLGKGEQLTAANYLDDKTRKGVVIVFRVTAAGEHSELLRLSGLRGPKPVFFDGGTKGFFNIEIDNDKYNMQNLWFIDGRKGIAKPLVKAEGGYAYSPDGKYLCYDDPVYYHQRTDSGYAHIILFDVEKERVIEEYDFAQYEDTRYLASKIKYDQESHVFKIGMFDLTVLMTEFHLDPATLKLTRIQ